METTKQARQSRENHDWFSPAIEEEGAVSSSLIAVEKDLQKKLKFMHALIKNLCHLSESEFDSVTDLWNQTRMLKTTLEVRLGVLNKDRPGGWFREAIYECAGPFQTKTLKYPVFTDYETSQYANVREQIQNCWRKATLLDNAHQKPGESLWRKLLAFNHRFQIIANIAIGEGFFITLDKVPHKLPAELDSPLVRQFLLNVAARLSRLRSELNECYSSLWKSSTLLWQQQVEVLEGAQWQPREGRRKSFSDRRKHKYSMSTGEFLEHRALRFMGFDRMPEPEELRSRYLSLAKKFHPDLAGGSDERFKRLGESYRLLTQKNT